ncbi:hypothetical protein ABKN59_000685 [Abortiporus biennis]
MVRKFLKEAPHSATKDRRSNRFFFWYVIVRRTWFNLFYCSVDFVTLGTHSSDTSGSVKKDVEHRAALHVVTRQLTTKNIAQMASIL